MVALSNLNTTSHVQHISLVISFTNSWNCLQNTCAKICEEYRHKKILISKFYTPKCSTHEPCFLLSQCSSPSLQLGTLLNLTFMGPCILNVFLSMTNKMQRCVILFIIVNAVHVSSGFSAHHQELKSVHAASGICQTHLLLLLAWMSWKSQLVDHA